MVAAVGWRNTYVVLAIPVFALGVGIFFVFRRRKDPVIDDGSAGSTPVDGADLSVRPTVEVVLFLILAGVVGAGVASMIAFIPLYLIDERGIDPTLAAAMLAIIYSAGIWAAPLGGLLSDRLGRLRVTVVLALLTGPAFIALLFVPPGFGLVVLLMTLGAMMFVKMPTAEAYIAGAVPPDRRATVLGVYFFSGIEVGAVLTPIIGRALDTYGFRAAFAGTGIGLFFIAAVAVMILFVRRLSPTGTR